MAIPRSSSTCHRSMTRSGGGPELAGELDEEVRAARERTVRLLGEELVRLAQRVGRDDRRLDGHQAAPRSAASRIASMIFV